MKLILWNKLSQGGNSLCHERYGKLELWSCMRHKTLVLKRWKQQFPLKYFYLFTRLPTQYNTPSDSAAATGASVLHYE